MTTTPSAVGAASHYDMNWPTIDWGKAHLIVRRLQMRIAKAVSEGRWDKVKAGINFIFLS
jgi:RNA-directed DNA polymerase